VPSAYYPLFLLMGPVLFILPAYQHLIMTISSLILFYPLVLTFKSPGCWSHELFEATTASVFSVIVIVVMTQYRIQSDSLKNKYYMLSRQDVLTGTANKSTGEAAAREYIAALRPDERCAMLLLDIDNFKSFNDGYGHLEGDRLLKMIGSTLIALCRKDDIVYRFGGDEFAILLKDVQTDDVAIQKARNIIDAITKIDNNYKTPPTCSIGICFRDGDKAGSEELIRRADAALYHAKRKGKNRFEVWTGGTHLQKTGATYGNSASALPK
jgi:diguanylate cyclase (GGDEF)-like protein